MQNYGVYIKMREAQSNWLAFVTICFSFIEGGFMYKQIYINIFKQLKDNKKVFLYVFLFWIIILTLLPLLIIHAPEELKKALKESIQVNSITAVPLGFHVVISVFLNNIKTMFFTILLGIVPFWIIPHLFLLLNASPIGFFLGLTGLAGYNPLQVFFVALFPHGLLEIPMECIALTLSLQVSSNVTKKILKKERKETLKECLKNSLLVYFFLIVPVLFISACIEGLITPLLMHTFL